MPIGTEMLGNFVAASWVSEAYPDGPPAIGTAVTSSWVEIGIPERDHPAGKVSGYFAADGGSAWFLGVIVDAADGGKDYLFGNEIRPAHVSDSEAD